MIEQSREAVNKRLGVETREVTDRLCLSKVVVSESTWPSCRAIPYSGQVLSKAISSFYRVVHGVCVESVVR